MQTEARIVTPNASEILEAVAAEWDHKFPVRRDAMTGEVQLGRGQIVMTADADDLTVTAIAEDAAALESVRLEAEKHIRWVLEEHELFQLCRDGRADMDWSEPVK